jgi:hypothetical protein
LKVWVKTRSLCHSSGTGSQATLVDEWLLPILRGRVQGASSSSTQDYPFPYRIRSIGENTRSRLKFFLGQIAGQKTRCPKFIFDRESYAVLVHHSFVRNNQPPHNSETNNGRTWTHSQRERGSCSRGFARCLLRFGMFFRIRDFRCKCLCDAQVLDPLFPRRKRHVAYFRSIKGFTTCSR